MASDNTGVLIPVREPAYDGVRINRNADEVIDFLEQHPDVQSATLRWAKDPFGEGSYLRSVEVSTRSESETPVKVRDADWLLWDLTNGFFLSRSHESVQANYEVR